MREREREGETFRERKRNPNPFPNSNSNSNSNPSPNSDSTSTNSSTLFVSNLPFNLDVFGLRGIFSRFGKVEEVSIPGIQKGRKRFGFVKFENHGDAFRSIRSLNKRFIRGVRIWVQFARREFFKVWHEHPSKVRRKSGSMPSHPLCRDSGKGILDLLDCVLKSVSDEVDKLTQVRKFLALTMGKIEELLDAKSYHPPKESAPVVDGPRKAATPRVGDSGPCNVEAENVEVVEDSFSLLKPAFIDEIEEGEIQVEEAEVEPKGLADAENSPAKELLLDPHQSDKICFSFKAKSKRKYSRRKKKPGKDRASRSQFSPKSRAKRKFNCQGSHPSNRCEKRLKRTEEGANHCQDEESFGLDTLFECNEIGVGSVSDPPEIADGNTLAPEVEDSPSSPSRISPLSSRSDSEMKMAEFAINIGNKLGMTVVGCPVGAKNKIARMLKRNRKYLSPATSISGTF